MIESAESLKLGIRGMAVRFFAFWAYPLIAIVLWIGAPHFYPNESWKDGVIVIPLGVLIWTIIEYIMHRFFFHWIPKWRPLRELIKICHLAHHENPRNPALILVQAEHSIIYSILSFAPIFWLSPTFYITLGLMSGVWMGFLYYELLHYQIHLKNSSSVVLKAQQRHHIHHHYANARSCFGVTSPLWDWVFSTYQSPSPTSNERR